VHAWPSLETVATLPPRKGATSVFTPLGDRILTTGLDGRPRLWTWPGLELVADIRALGKKAVGYAFTPDAEHVLISGLDGTLARVRLKDGEIDVLRPAGGPLLCALAFVPGEDRLIMVEHGGSVRLFEWPGLEPLHESPIGAAGVFTLRFHPSEEVFGLCIERGVQIRRSTDGSLLGTLAIPAKGVYALAFSADEQWLAAGGADQRIRIWRMTPER
jgi:WD40 repeat protein